MKSNLSPEMRAKTHSNILVVAAGMAMLGVLVYLNNILTGINMLLGVITPFLIGIGLAFLQLPIVRNVELVLKKTLFRRCKRPKLMRAISTTIALLAILALLTAFLGILLPQIVSSVRSLISIIGAFVNENAESMNQLLGQIKFLSFEGAQVALDWQKIFEELTKNIMPLLDSIMVVSSAIYQPVFQLFIGLITAFYLLMDKEHLCAQFKKITYAFVPKETSESLIYWTRRASRIFSGFLSGKIIDSIIIGCLCYVGMLIFRIEYPLLISVIVGITNILPFFGPFIGAIPSVLILLIVNPYSALWFGIFIVVLQQIDGNIIGPLILGDSVGIEPLWIMISIVIGGGLFGFTGMLLSVPAFALLYAILRALADSRLKKRGMPVPSNEYLNFPPQRDDDSPHRSRLFRKGKKKNASR